MNHTVKLIAKSALLILLSATASVAAAGQRQSPESLEDVTESAGIEPQLRALLGVWYERFAENFQELAYPVHLKDGGVLVDGWREGCIETCPVRNAAALVYYPGGKVFAAYYNAEEGRVSYFGSAVGNPHYALELWALRFDLENLQSSASRFDVYSGSLRAALPARRAGR